MPPTIGIIAGFDLVGDALMKLPFLRALRSAFPDARIVWMTSHGPTVYSGIMRSTTQHLLDDVLEKPGFLPTCEQPDAPLAAAPRFSILIDTRNRWREALQARRVPHDVFIAPALRYLLSDRKPLLFLKKLPHIVDRLMQMATLAAGKNLTTAEKIRLPQEARQGAARALPEGPVYVGFAPGSGQLPKTWPLDNYIQVAALQKNKGRVPVFLLGPAEMDWQKPIADKVPDALFPLQNRAAWGHADLRIEDTIALGERMAGAVVNDSGTSHMLAAADCALVSLFGPSNASKLAPRVSRIKVLRAQDFGKGDAMMQIPVEAVLASLDSLCEKN